MAQVGLVAYKLQLLDGATIHSVFHVSQLRLAIGASHSSSDLPRQLNDELELLVEPEEVLGLRTCSLQGCKMLIRLKDVPASEATWELFEVIQNQF